MWPGKRKSNKRGKKSLFYREGISVVTKITKGQWKKEEKMTGDLSKEKGGKAEAIYKLLVSRAS